MANYDEKAKARTMKYMKEKRDKLTLNLPLGDKEKYRAYAESKGKSLTALIVELIETDMENEQKANEPKKGISDIPECELLECIKLTVNTSADNEYEEVYTLDKYIEEHKDDYYASLDQKRIAECFTEQAAVDILNGLRDINYNRKKYYR